MKAQKKVKTIRLPVDTIEKIEKLKERLRQEGLRKVTDGFVITYAIEYAYDEKFVAYVKGKALEHGR